MTETEKQMLLHEDLLRVMLGSSAQGSKQFGACLAQMCKDDAKLSRKICKILLKSIGLSNYESVKNYLSALKPFLRLQDSLKAQKLEWILGLHQVLALKNYRETLCKYGLEHADRINEDTYTYVTFCNGLHQDSLLKQLVNCRGKLENFAINCLKDLLSLMAKDEDIARFVYNSQGPTYQFARYSDWFRGYLLYHKEEIEKSNIPTYFKEKYDKVVKSIKYLEKYEETCQKIDKENREEFKDFHYEPKPTERNPEVIEHYPAQLIVGKCIESKELLKKADENVEVTVFELSNEFGVS